MEIGGGSSPLHLMEMDELSWEENYGCQERGLNIRIRTYNNTALVCNDISQQYHQWHHLHSVI